jgi:hypothetical protein
MPPLGTGRAGGLAAGGPSAPSHRPGWLLVLSSVTLIYGGLMLVSGLTALRDPSSAAKFPITRPLAPEEEAMTRELVTISGEIVARHAGAIRGRAAASTLLALLMLYSAAAALSRDRHGRTATLVAAWLGIVYQVASLPLVIPIARDYAEASAPILLRMVAADTASSAAAAASSAASAADAAATAGDAATAASLAGAGSAAAGADASAGTAGAPTSSDPSRPETVAGFTQTVFLGIPIVTAFLGVVGSLLLIGYFGGRRGRALYGLPPRR